MNLDPKKLPESFCILPWIHSAVDPDGGVRPCCVSTPYNFRTGYINETNRLVDVWNSDKYKTLRTQMLAGEWPKSCSQCKVNEEAKGTSYRTESNVKFHDQVASMDFKDDGSAEFKQIYIDYRFTNKCNFKCITCGESYSSSWAVETKKEILVNRPKGPWKLDADGKPYMMIADGKKHYSPIIEIDGDSLIADFKLFSKDLQSIYFAGGEPLISDPHYEILNILIERQQPVTLTYNTNFSELNYKGIDVLDMWSKINGLVVLFPSVDGYGPKGECIRDGFVTEIFQENIKKVLEFNKAQGPFKRSNLFKIQLNYNITFGNTNILDVVDTVKWLEQQHQGYEQPAPKIAFNPIFYPLHYSLRSLDKAQKEQVCETLKEQIDAYLVETENKKRASDMIDNLLKWVQNADYEPITKQAATYTIQVLDTTARHKTLNWREHLVFLRDFLEKTANQNDK